ncbi:VirB8/TrbF family protein [Eleftheria terrae]|uniref:VirB8/TrbF family protein n=1 Tax=Eleftheria terrae TaxID=1597781 RepID=UPI00263A84C6|nr:VirB8/TrbF family protein [Eleftheria terrae]WKB50510.1 VirB8/TrbF family protein [Eleftheria terrae]
MNMEQHMQKARPIQPGGLMDQQEYQTGLKKGRYAATQAFLRASRNIGAIREFILLALLIFVTFAWYRADERFANNVRVAWVKLMPDGTTSVEYADESTKIDFFPATVESKLSEYVERRFSKLRKSIDADYGFANLLMSDKLSKEFTDPNGYNAAEVSARLANCDGCNETQVTVRNLQSIDKDPLPKSKKDYLFTTLAFVRVKETNKDHQVVDCKNQIITLIWTFRPTEKIVARRAELRYNPIGIEIDRESVRDDPTPVNIKECTKNETDKSREQS